MIKSPQKFFKAIANRERLKLIGFSFFSFCILIISLTFFTLSISRPYMGTVLSMNDQGWVVQSVDPNGLAIQANIVEGDMPVEINGQPAKTFLEKYENSRTVVGMLITELTVVNERGQIKSVTLKDNTTSWESLTEVITWFFVCLIFWITGFFVFFKRPKNVAALLLCLASLSFGLTLSAVMAAERAIPSALFFEIIAAVFGPWLLFHFFLILPEERTWLYNNRLLYLIYLPATITLILFPLVGYADGQSLQPFRTIRLLEYAIGFLATIMVVMLNYVRTTSIKTRHQMKIVLLSTLCALIPFLVLTILPEAIWRHTILPTGFSILFLGFIPLGMGYTVVTQKLMDIDIVIRRGLVYTLITVVMAGILSAGIFTVLAFQESLGVPEEIVLALAIGGITTVLFGPAKKRIESLLDRFLYKDRYDYRQTIESMSKSLNSLKDFTEVSRFIVGTIVNVLNLAGGCLIVKTQSGSFELSAAKGIHTNRNKQKRLLTLLSHRSQIIEFPNSSSNAAPDLAFLIPLVAAGKEIGILCLSPKVTRQDFTADDMYLLQGLVSVAAIALHSAMLIRDVSIRNTFVSIASHELRTPMTAIMGYTELLLQRNPPDTTREQWLNNIYENGQKLTDMIDELLNVTRIQSGKVSMKLEEVRLQVIFEDSLAITRESSDKHEFIVDIEPDLPAVLVDREKFGQVMGNLLSNAVKYSPEGGRITLAARKDMEKYRVVVSVSDEGIGISSEDKDSLFTTFHRIQRPETQGIRGSGLGLYIAKEWTEAMGGEIWLESELNKGSTFFVAIPVQDSKSIKP